MILHDTISWKLSATISRFITYYHLIGYLTFEKRINKTK